MIWVFTVVAGPETGRVFECAPGAQADVGGDFVPDEPDRAGRREHP